MRRTLLAAAAALATYARSCARMLSLGVALLGAALALAACAGDPQTRATAGLAVACDTYAAALEQLTPLRAAGKLSAETVARVDAANRQVRPLCGGGSAVEPAVAVDTVQAAIALINKARGQ